MSVKWAAPLLATLGAVAACASQLPAQNTAAGDGLTGDAGAGEIWEKVTGDMRGFDRADAARRIAERLKASEDYTAELYRLKRRQSLTGEDMTTQIKAPGAAPSLPAPAGLCICRSLNP